MEQKIYISSKTYRFNKKEFTEHEHGKYYNLTTGRYIKGENHSDLIFMENPKVAGDREKLIEFYQANGMQIPEKLIGDDKLRGIIDLVVGIAKGFVRAVGETIKDRLCMLPFEKPKLQQIDYYSQEDFDQLIPFNFSGVKTKCIISRIIDGDTVDIIFSAPISHFTKPRTEGKVTGVVALTSAKSDIVLTIKQKCRLYGIDAGESSTIQGLIATEVLKKLVLHFNGRLYVWCLHPDKYGRMLIDLYCDSRFKNKFINSLLAFNHPIIGRCFLPYDGKTKSKFPELTTDQVVRFINTLDENERQHKAVVVWINKINQLYVNVSR